MDLRPYTCFFVNCAFVDNPFPNQQLWIDHLEIEHGFGPVWEGIQCPLCLEHTEDGKGVVLTHLASHMEDIALMALPRGVNSDKESDCKTSSRSDSIHEPETSVGEDILHIDGRLKSRPDIFREGQKEKFPNGGKSIDKIDKPDMHLNSSDSLQEIESIDENFHEATESPLAPPTHLVRNDDGTEASIQATLEIWDLESSHTTPNDLSPAMAERRPIEDRQAPEPHGDKNGPSELGVPHREPKAKPRSSLSIKKCFECRREKREVIASRILSYRQLLIAIVPPIRSPVASQVRKMQKL
jgi:hypothetical protein